MTRAHKPNASYAPIARWAGLGLLFLGALYIVMLVYSSSGPLVGVCVLGALALIAYVYTSRRTHALRYLFPGLAGMLIFIVAPFLFTIWLGFTNYSSQNILTYERATEVLLSRTYERGSERMSFQLHADGEAYRLVLRPEPVEAVEKEELDEDDGDSIFDDVEGEGDGDSIFDDVEGDGDGDSIFDDDEGDGDSIFDDDGAHATGGDAGSRDAPQLEESQPAAFVTEPVALEDLDGELQVSAALLTESAFEPGEPLSIKELIARQEALQSLRVRLPSGTVLVKIPQGLNTFAAEAPLYVQNDDGTLTNQKTGAVVTPNFDTGFYETADGEPLTPGFRVHVGLDNYARLFTDTALRGPLLSIFLWTVTFSGLSVLFTLLVGAVLAELLNWEGLRFRTVYRVLLFLPYAVPAFLSILLFKGLFQENIGEINLILQTLFGIKPHWFTDPFLAKTMILIVNTWLGYPYMMLLWLGLRQAIPDDLYEATALAGAGPLTNFFKITWPLVRRPLMPLLVSSFAFNFNNFVLIQLLTNGRPDFLDTALPAGTNDILVTYTYRIAFEDTGQQFGLAAAIAALIFILIAGLSLLNLKLTKVNESQTQ